ncbi:MAG: hypothetical protein AVDCRST_MAG55-1908, partial [uncultured Rubrobacteraceae bacterium]
GVQRDRLVGGPGQAPAAGRGRGVGPGRPRPGPRRQHGLHRRLLPAPDALRRVREPARGRGRPVGDLREPAAEPPPTGDLPGEQAVAHPRRPGPLRRLRRGAEAQGPV